LFLPALAHGSLDQLSWLRAASSTGAVLGGLLLLNNPRVAYVRKFVFISALALAMCLALIVMTPMVVIPISLAAMFAALQGNSTTGSLGDAVAYISGVSTEEVLNLIARTKNACQLASIATVLLFATMLSARTLFIGAAVLLAAIALIHRYRSVVSLRIKALRAKSVGGKIPDMAEMFNRAECALVAEIDKQQIPLLEGGVLLGQLGRIRDAVEKEIPIPISEVAVHTAIDWSASWYEHLWTVLSNGQKALNALLYARKAKKMSERIGFAREAETYLSQAVAAWMKANVAAASATYAERPTGSDVPTSMQEVYASSVAVVRSIAEVAAVPPTSPWWRFLGRYSRVG
jgi:hypothetical protein